jgi:HlyD family secretion protein
VFKERAMTRPHHTSLLAVAFVLLAAGAYLVWRWPIAVLTDFLGPRSAVPTITVSGNIEAHESVLSFTQVQAPIVDLPFDEGAAVKPGTVLARVDDSLYQHQVDIDGANEKIAAAQIAVNESTLLAAQKSVISDQADLAEKQLDYQRAEQLMKTSAGSVQARDLARTAAEQSAAQLAHDQAMVQVAASNIVLAQANSEAATARRKLDQVTLGYTTLRAPFAGVIAVREAELGQLAGPGVAIFSLDDLDHVWLRAYINEQDIGKARLDQPVTVATDTYPGKTYHGRISFISPDAEFTPKTVETHAERITLVYRVRIDIDNPTHELLPGMPADADIALLPAGS